MAQYFNVVTNSNGTFTIEDLQQICIDGQSVQFVVEDNNGANIIPQPILAYAAAPDNNQQTLFSQSSINLGGHVGTAQSETRPSVYIIKTNDPPIQQSIYSKADSDNSKFESTNNTKGSKEQLNTCYTQTQADWLSTRENNESFELVIKKDPSPVKSLVTNTVRNQQQIITTQISAPNAVIQGVTKKKPARLVPLTKRHSIGGPNTGILRTTLQNPNTQTGKVGKMRRNSNISNNPNVSLTARSRASTGVSTTQLVTPPRAPQARPPIHADAPQRNSISASKNAYLEMGHLSERIRQATLKQRQQNSEQRQIQKQQQPVMAVTPMPRPVQPVQAPVQRQRAMGQLLSSNQQQQLQQQQQQLQQQQLLRQQATAMSPSQQNRQIQATTMTENVDEPMEVEQSDTVVQLDRLNQYNCAGKSEAEENSSESIAYLQQEIDDPHTAIVQQQITGNEAKMLVILENGEQRLITFEVPKEDCTVQDLLEQANIYSSQEPHVSLVSDPALGINYIVDVTSRSAILEEEHVEAAHSEPMAVTTTIVEVKTPVKTKNTNAPTMPAPAVSPRIPKYVKGMLAVCSFCGMSAADFNYCMRCKRKLPENVKAIPISSGLSSKKESTVPTDTFYKKTEPGSKADREAVSKRGRGRGRGIARTRQIKEPECLTISSDEEDDNRKQKRLGGNKETNLLNSSSIEEYDRIIDKEPIITNNSLLTTTVQLTTNNPTSGGKEQDTLLDAATSHLSTYLTCRTVRIGSYKYIPTDKIFVSGNGLKLEVPLLEDDKSFITLDIKLENLVKVLMHFNKSMPVIFFYPNIPTALMIRDLLGMQDPKGPYFDPTGKDHTHRRITLLPEMIEDESKAILKELYKPPIFEELTSKEANDILVKASPKTNQKTQVQALVKKQTSTSSSSTNSNGVIQTITVYPPPPAKGGIAINTEDFICLAEDQFLNDVIIDFYLKYLTSERLSPDDHNRTHVFSSYFYKRLTSPHSQAVENTENISPAARRHARVQKWTKNVNIFEKDFVVIPINEHAHWFLAIICFPGLVGSVTSKVEEKPENQKSLDKKKKDSKTKTLTIGSTTITPVSTITLDTNDDGSERDEAEGDDEEMESDSDDDDESESKPSTEQVEESNCQDPQNKEVTKVPCILIFDSLTGATRVRVVATLRDYLSCEYQAKMGTEKIFTKDNIKGACPRVPQQSNFTDCGLYVLQYVESFFQTPIMDYTLPIKTLKTWFEEIVVTRKREEIANLLTELVNNTKGDKTINLPALTFPTQDGKLKQKSDSQTEEQQTKVSTRPLKTETESKKKVVEVGVETKLNAAISTTETTESSTESPSKSGISQLTIPESSNQILSTTDSTLIVHKEAATSTTTKSVDTMAFLKNKRIPRLQKSSDNPEEKQVAKKHKGDSFDSCK